MIRHSYRYLPMFTHQPLHPSILFLMPFVSAPNPTSLVTTLYNQTTLYQTANQTTKLHQSHAISVRYNQRLGNYKKCCHKLDLVWYPERLGRGQYNQTTTPSSVIKVGLGMYKNTVVLVYF